MLEFASPVAFLVTLIGTLIWSASSVINNTYGRDIGGIALLATVGYALTIDLLSFVDDMFPGDKRSYPKRVSLLLKGFLVKGAWLALIVVFYFWCALALSIGIGTIYALLHGGGEDVFQAIVQFYKFFIWGAVGVSVLTMGVILLRHWIHLLLFIEHGSSCDGYYHHWFNKDND